MSRIPDKTIPVGHLDTGVDAGHPALIGKVSEFIAIDREGNVWKTDRACDTESHGTHTAGIILASAENALPGPGPEISLCSVSTPKIGKIILNILAGMDALLDRDIRVACMAVGILQKTPVFLEMIDAFHEKGVLAIVPAGNKGEGNIHSPGSYPGVLSVGAIGKNGGAARFSGSYSNENGVCMKPDIMAPGVNIMSAAPGGKTVKKSGTSMACAHVAGVAARLIAAEPEATADEIKDALLTTAGRLPTSQRHRCRTGVVNPEDALEHLRNNGGRALNSTSEELPLFLKEQYIDRRFSSKHKRAKADELIESIVVARKDDQTRDRNSTAALIEIASAKNGAKPENVRLFRNADMAHVQAAPAFYDKLLKRDELFVCSAVDVNIFEM